MKRTLAWLMIPVFLAVNSSWAVAQKKGKPGKGEPPSAAGYPYPPGTILAFSLKVLQKRLQEDPQKTMQHKDLRHLAGITRIDGYVVDEANQDIVLYGVVDPGLPPLYLEDFILALKNAWLKFAERQGNTLYYADPGCSIDPDPRVMQELNKVAARMNAQKDVQGKQQEINNWHRVCRSPQAVRVMGIPFDTRFAWVMVKADYDMKNLVNGTDTLKVPGFASLMDMRLDQVKSDVQAGRATSVPASSMNRFWFHPGQNLYKEDVGVVKITQCPVILLTEEEHLTRRGEIKGTGQMDPWAQKFSEGFSAHYREVARERPIYQELEALFRWVALAKIMKFKGADREAGLNLGYVLDQAPVYQVEVQRQLPGRSNVKEFEHRRDYEGGYSILQMWFPSCGGVTVSLKMEPNLFKRDATGMMKELKTRVQGTRPEAESLYWPFILPDEVRLDGQVHPLASLW